MLASSLAMEAAAFSNCQTKSIKAGFRSPELRFITVNNPADAKSQAHKRAVRSHAAHRKHLMPTQGQGESSAPRGYAYNRRRAKKTEVSIVLEMVDTSVPQVEFHIDSPEEVSGHAIQCSYMPPQSLLVLEENNQYESPCDSIMPILSTAAPKTSAYDMPLVMLDRGFGGGSVDPFRSYPLPFEPL